MKMRFIYSMDLFNKRIHIKWQNLLGLESNCVVTVENSNGIRSILQFLFIQSIVSTRKEHRIATKRSKKLNLVANKKINGKYIKIWSWDSCALIYIASHSPMRCNGILEDYIFSVSSDTKRSFHPLLNCWTVILIYLWRRTSSLSQDAVRIPII